jgi:hypothetical protein
MTNPPDTPQDTALKKTLFEDAALYKQFQEKGIVDCIDKEICSIDESEIISEFKKFVNCNKKLFEDFKEASFKLGGMYTSDTKESQAIRNSIRQLSTDLRFLDQRHEEWSKLLDRPLSQENMLKNMYIITKRASHWYTKLLRDDKKSIHCMIEHYASIHNLLNKAQSKYESFSKLLNDPGTNLKDGMSFFTNTNTGNKQQVFGGRTKRKPKRRTKRRTNRK